MRNPRRVLILTAVLLVTTACNSVPLPEDMPTDFYYSWRYDRLEPSDAPNPSDRPGSILLSVDPGGLVRHEVAWGDPRPTEKKGDHTVDETSLRAIYDAVRAANLYEKSSAYQGEDLSLGRETFYVVGHNETKQVVVEGMSLDELSALREALFQNIPLAEILTRPEEIHNVYILDWRTGVFHKGNCPMCKDIPEASRREFPNPWAALDAKGTPCGQCDPMGGD